MCYHSRVARSLNKSENTLPAIIQDRSTPHQGILLTREPIARIKYILKRQSCSSPPPVNPTSIPKRQRMPFSQSAIPAPSSDKVTSVCPPIAPPNNPKGMQVAQIPHTRPELIAIFALHPFILASKAPTKTLPNRTDNPNISDEMLPKRAPGNIP